MALARQLINNSYSGPMATGDDLGLDYIAKEVPFEPAAAGNLLKQAIHDSQ